MGGAAGGETQPVPAQAGNEPGLTQGLKETGNYTVTTAPAEPLHLDPPKLPDLSGYTAAAVEAKIVRKPVAAPACSAWSSSSR